MAEVALDELEQQPDGLRLEPAQVDDDTALIAAVTAVRGIAPGNKRCSAVQRALHF
jgi:hypothetical protein